MTFLVLWRAVIWTSNPCANKRQRCSLSVEPFWLHCLLTVRKNVLEYVLIVIYCSASYPSRAEGIGLRSRWERNPSLLPC